jgi:hypothetical protein
MTDLSHDETRAHHVIAPPESDYDSLAPHSDLVGWGYTIADDCNSNIIEHSRLADAPPHIHSTKRKERDEDSSDEEFEDASHRLSQGIPQGGASTNEAFMENERLGRIMRRQQTEAMIEEDPVVGQAAERLIPMLGNNWEGCGEDKHHQSLAEHVENEGPNEHNPLAATYNPARLSPAYKSSVGLRGVGFPLKSGMPRSTFPDPATLKELYEGILPEHADENTGESFPKMICLHVEQEHVEEHTPCYAKDTDSIVVFPQSLAALREPLQISMVYNPTQTIQATLHQPLSVTVFDEHGTPAPMSLEFRDLPHVYIGHGEGLKSDVFMAFPRMWSKDQRNNYLTKSLAQQLYNCVTRPAIIANTSPTHKPYMPLSHELADINAYAKSRESGRATNGSRKQMSHHSLAIGTNGGVWDHMLATINRTNGLHHFQDPVLLVDIKNIKSRTTRDDLYESMDMMDELLERMFDETHIPPNMFLLDLGAITAPRTPDTYRRDGCVPDEAITYGWKRCCTEAFISDLQRDGFHDATRKPSYQIYTIAGLQDMVALSLEPPPRCYLQVGGLRYVQRYSCVKTLFDAQGTYPFGNPAIFDLCVDDKIFGLAARKLNKVASAQRDASCNAFNHSKTRVFETCTCKTTASYGIRFEMRVTRPLWHAIKRRAYAMSNQPIDTAVQRQPAAAWAIRTEDFLAYLHGNYDKLISLVEMCALTSPLSGRTLDQSRLMKVTLQCIQQFFNTNYDLFPALKLRRSEGERRLYGLGFEVSLRVYGYVWWRRRRVNWEALEFESTIGKSLAGHIDEWLLPWFHNAGELIISQTEGISHCYRFLEGAKEGGFLEKGILTILAHKLLKTYRIDVLSRLNEKANAIQTDAQSMIKHDQVRFSWDGLASVIVGEIHAATGNKTLATTPALLFTWLWEDTKDCTKGHSKVPFNRGHWSYLSYRSNYKEIAQYLTTLDKNGALAGRFRQVLYNEFFMYHWAIIYPSPGGALTSVTKQGGRVVWNVGQISTLYPKFTWSKVNHRPGVPPALPHTCFLKGQELRLYLEGLQSKDKLTKDV